MRRAVFVKSVCLVALAAAIGVACAFWLWPGPPSTATQGEAATPTRPPVVTAEGVLATDGEALLSDPRCRLHRGAGTARDAAAAVVTDAAGAGFVGLDGSGPVFGGDVPFPPERVLLRRRGDGALVAAFGVGDPARLRVFLAGEVVADEHGVLDFGLARDGAEWFLVRRNPDGEFAVEQHDTATGGQRTFTANWLRDGGAGLSHTGAYALVDNAIVFAPRKQDESVENAHYVRTTRDTTRMVRLGSPQQTILESDSHIYALQKWYQQHGLAKRVFRWDAKGEDRVVQAWWRPLAVAPATVRMFRSDDGAWIGLFGWELVVLDAATGEPVLSFPVRGDKRAELARLDTVLSADATVRDVGQARSARIAHDVLLVRRDIPGRPGRDAADDGATVAVVDVFRMANLHAGAGPDTRLPADAVHRCLVDIADFPLPFVDVDADGFAYVPAVPVDTGGFQPSPPR